MLGLEEEDEESDKCLGIITGGCDWRVRKTNQPRNGIRLVIWYHQGLAPTRQFSCLLTYTLHTMELRNCFERVCLRLQLKSTS